MGEVGKAWAEWILQKMPEPACMVTLTFAQEDVSEYVAKSKLKSLIRVLNESQLGKNYRRKVRHSYFGYVAVMERQRRGTIHWHMLIDRWVPWKLLHGWWQSAAGYAWVAKVDDAKNWKSEGTVQGAARYLAKYLTKDSTDVEMWVAEKDWRKGPTGLLEAVGSGDPEVKAEERSVP